MLVFSHRTSILFLSSLSHTTPYFSPSPLRHLPPPLSLSILHTLFFPPACPLSCRPLPPPPPRRCRCLACPTCSLCSTNSTVAFSPRSHAAQARAGWANDCSHYLLPPNKLTSRTIIHFHTRTFGKIFRVEFQRYIFRDDCKKRESAKHKVLNTDFSRLNVDLLSQR